MATELQVKIGAEPVSKELEFNEGHLHELGGFLASEFDLDSDAVLEVVDEYVQIKRGEGR